MNNQGDDRVGDLIAAAIGRLEGDPQFDLEGYVRAHPEEEAELRSRLARLRAAGLLPGQSPPGSRSEASASPTTTDPGAIDELLSALRRKPPVGDRYELRGEIGSGGMGRVVEVFDRELRRTLAMKLLRAPGSDSVREEMAARFLEEAQVTAQLSHQGIVPIFDLGIDEEGALYYTMRLIEGLTLKEVFELARRGEGGWTKIRALDAILRACEAVAYAHQRGVITVI